VWTAALALALGGCAAQERAQACADDGDCGLGQACVDQLCRVVECRLNSDCPVAQECVENVCRDRTGCDSDGQCAAGQICADGQCQPGCRVDADCLDGLVCVTELSANGLCVACRLDADCPAGQRCLGYLCRASCQSSADCEPGVCEPSSGTCVDCLQDNHCPAGQVCQSNLCRAGCRADADCPQGQLCDPATRLCVTVACQDKDECELGELCLSGRCVPGCESSRDCPAGQECLPAEGPNGLCAECVGDADCPVGLRCIGHRCTDQCLSDADCPDGVCHPQAQVCVDCIEDGNCGAGEVCSDGVCRPGCRSDGDCPSGRICEAATCVDGCRIDSDCAAGQICEAARCRTGCRSDQDCQNGTCDLIAWQCVGFECTSQDQCQLGQVCVAQHCVSGCVESRDCPPGLVCAAQLDAHGRCVQCLDTSDCPDPDFPRCVAYQCAPECWTDQDCPGDLICLDLSCQSLPDECQMRIQPSDPVDFGTVPLGASRTVAFELRNVGGQACTVSAIDLTSSLFYPADFLLGGQPALPQVLGPGERIELDVILAPEQEGEHAASLWITTDDPDLLIGSGDLFRCGLYGVDPGEACIPLNGNGIRLDVQPVPAALDLGPARVGCATSEQTVRFYNLGIAVAVVGVELAQAFDPDFEIAQAPALPAPLPSGGQFEVAVRFHPQSSGPQTNTLVIRFEDPNLPALHVPLSGQGVSSEQTHDTFELPAVVLVDVLWVVDNSGSMGEEQTALATNFSQFIGLAISLGVDFHVGVVTTEVNDSETGQGDPPRPIDPGVLVQAPGRPRFITPQTPDPEAAFADNVSVGTCCSDEQEAGLEASWMALSPPRLVDPQANAGFLRADAKLYVIYVSDEQDQSAGPVDFYVDYFLTLKGGTELATLSAICGPSPSGCTGSMGDAEAGTRYVSAQQQTDGMFQSICQSGWSGLMTELGEHAFAPRRLFPLSRPAAQGSLVVRIDSSLVPQASVAYAPDGWTYLPGDNAIWFGDWYLPGTGASISIDYTALCL
jgi:Cys-rich repeat protein